MEKRNRFDKDVMERALRDYHAGVGIKQLCELHGFSKSSFYYWLSKHGEAKPKAGDRMADLKAENTQLRQLLANRVLEIIFAGGKAAVETKQLQKLLGLQTEDAKEG